MYMVCRHARVSVMEVIRHAELIVEWFLWTIEHTNRSLDDSNVAFELSSDLLVCSIVQRNHSTMQEFHLHEEFMYAW